MPVPKLRFKDDNGAEYPAWEKVFIGDICTVTNGKGNTQDKIDNGSYPFYVRSDKVERSNKYIFDCEAIITSGDGVGVGKIYHYIKGKFNLHQRCYAMFGFKNVLPRYFYYYFSTHFYKRVKRLSAKGSVDSVRLEFITKMNILVPQLDEQKKIADFLTTFDKRIIAQQNIIADIEQTKKGLLQKIFSQEIRFKDDNGEDYPTWKKKKLKEILNFQYGKFNNNPDNGGEYPIYGANGIIGGYTEYNAENSIIIGHMGAYAGKVLWEKGKHFVTYNGIITKTKDTMIFDNKYGYYALMNMNIPKLCAGSGQPFLSYEDLNFIKMNIPCLEEQNKIASFLSTYDKKLEAEKKILADLQEMKKGLLQQMFI